MRIFSGLYDKMLQWARHPHASYYLAGISFSESSFFPIPPDVMLAPMALAKPERAWWYAGLATITSLLGAILGYLLGMFCFNLIHPLIEKLGYGPGYQQVQIWFAHWGFWVLLFAGSISPVPFKLFTIAAGALHMALLPFLIGSLIGRSIRYYLVSALMVWGGARMDAIIRRSIDWLGWVLLILLALGYTLYRWQL
jgi:membrane protein YqaA with SNARE-associated domain